MNATVGITQKQFDDWQDDVSPWAPAMFTSPFGESLQPVPDPHFWGSPGNSSEEYCRTNSQSTRDDLRHSFDAADNFETGYMINAGTRQPALPGSEHNGALGGGGYDYHRHSVAQMTGLSDPRQQQPIDPYAPRGGGGRHYSDGDEGLFDDSLTTSSTTAASQQHSASPSALRSPAGSSSWDWSGEQQQQQQQAGTTASTLTGSTTSPNPNANANFDTNANTNTNTRMTREVEVGVGVAGPQPPKSRRNRERNRVAAHKCRQKAKQSMTDLQARERELSRQNHMLQEHAGSLRDEILDLKNEILRHSECNSDIIQNYIARAARDVN